MPHAEWLPVRVRLRDDARTVAIAATVGLSERETVGLLVDVWGWARETTASGFVPGVSASWLDRRFGVQRLAAAMAAAGWLVIDPEGRLGLEFPEWHVWLSKGAKARLMAAQRAKRSRAKRKAERNPTPPLRGLRELELEPLPGRRNGHHGRNGNGTVGP